MSLWDYCLPLPPIECPRCEGTLTDWQFRDGEVGFFVWQQGHAAPISQRVDPEIAARPEYLANRRLPPEFRLLYGECASCGYRWRGDALGRCDASETWRTTELVPAPLVGRIIEGDWLQCPECCDALQLRPPKHLYLCPTCQHLLSTPTIQPPGAA